MAKTIAMIFGVIYTAVGILGFIPQIGGSYTITQGVLLGIADVNVLHNIVHLAIGIAGLTMARTDEGAATYCKTFGVILLLVGVLGFLPQPLFGIVPIGDKDIWIHLISGVVVTYAGFATATTGRAVTTG